MCVTHRILTPLAKNQYVFINLLGIKHKAGFNKCHVCSMFVQCLFNVISDIDHVTFGFCRMSLVHNPLGDQNCFGCRHLL